MPQPLIEAKNIVRKFKTRNYSGWGMREVFALDDVSIDLQERETVAIVGESGSGKSTLARIVLGLDMPTSGACLFRGTEYPKLDRAGRQKFIEDVQVVFQDPGSSLNPKKTIGRILGEVASLHRLVPNHEIRDFVVNLLATVGLEASIYNRSPHELSGGQKQRVAIGRAISVNPSIIIADEALSALDVSIQSQILDLMEDLQHRLGVAYLFISHDLNVVRDIADRTVVMRHGKVVETGPTRDVLGNPQEQYTQQLLDATW